MKEIVTVDGKRFELTTDYPLSEQQRQQTISDIRKQSGCSTCNKTQSLDGSIQTLQTDCIDIEVKAPAFVTVASVTILDGGCTTEICPTIICPTIACDTIVRTVVVAFLNSGDLDADITPQITVRESPTFATHVIVPARDSTTGYNGRKEVTFTGVILVRGSNHICASYTPYTQP